VGQALQATKECLYQLTRAVQIKRWLWGGWGRLGGAPLPWRHPAVVHWGQ
jgi:hypothetical protein